MRKHEETGDEEAARLGCVGTLTGLGCAVVLLAGGTVLLFAVAMLLRDYQG
jgi:hypothetical protein